MSLEDLFKADLTPVFVVVGIVLILGFLFGNRLAKKVNNEIYGDEQFGSVKEVSKVKILRKKTEPHPLNKAGTIHYVVFEFVNGGQIDLAIKDFNTYSAMFEGDCGTLEYQGKKFIRFVRGKSDETS